MKTLEEKVQNILSENNYVKKGYGYTKKTKHLTHWITFFEKNQIQMYGYYTEEDLDQPNIYSTGVVKGVTPELLSSLIKLFTTNHK